MLSANLAQKYGHMHYINENNNKTTEAYIKLCTADMLSGKITV